MGQLIELIDQYCGNIDKQRELNDSLLEKLDKKEWVEKMRSRSVSLRALTEDNGRLTAEINAILEGDFTEAEIEELYKKVYDMYINDYTDYEVIHPILKKLLDWYEGTADYEKRIFLYTALNFVYNEVQSRGSGEMHLKEEALLRIFALKEHYRELSHHSRRAIWVAYYNYIIVSMDNPNFDINESYGRLMEANDFWNSAMVQEMDAENAEIAGFVSMINSTWAAVVKYADDATEEVKAYLIQYANEYHQRELDEGMEVADFDCYVYALYLWMRAQTGLCDMGEAVEAYLEYYGEVIKKYEARKTPDNMMQLCIINIPEILLPWVGKLTDEERKREIVHILMDATKKTLFKDVKELSSQFTNSVLAKWCLSVLPYLQDIKEKEDWIFGLIVRRQLPTYLHSVMVSYMAKVYARVAFEKMPELFEDLPERAKADLPKFMESCGLFHDIGKTQIADVINLQGRKLNDDEFDFIKRHPKYGAYILSQDEDLACYADVSLGHHRFYDGSRGYPAEYDPVATPYRIAVDIIRICDTMDAATDHLGRNYKFTKKFRDIWEELKRDAGTSFNPQLVALLDQVPELAEKLRFLCEEGRENVMFAAYEESLEIC